MASAKKKAKKRATTARVVAYPRRTGAAKGSKTSSTWSAFSNGGTAKAWCARYVVSSGALGVP
jgi:hypothetical protein